ncbi:MAG: chromate transporter [Treponema sp.]|nr:chromate transporter [Treponema sp.]
MNLLDLFGLHGMHLVDLVQLGLHFAMLSLLAVGGALAVAPDMQHYFVIAHGWMNDEQFTTAVALAQSAPGPNVLFVGILGLRVAGLVGMATTLIGMMLPSSILARGVGRFRTRRAESIGLRAITAGLTPLTLGLLLSTGWVLLAPTRVEWSAWVLVAITVVAMLRTKASPLLLIALGAAAGMAGLV